MLGVKEDPRIRIKHRFKFFCQAVFFGTLKHIQEGGLVGELVESFIVKKAVRTLQPRPLPKRGALSSSATGGVPELKIKQPKQVVLTEYRVEQHVTPKTNAAKAHWAGLPLNKKESFSLQPNRLSKLPGYKSHLDLRILLPGTEKWISFAIPKGIIPQPGKKVQLVQSTAKHGYHEGNPPVIESGYGMGVTKVVSKGHCLLSKGRDGTVHLWMEDFPEQFVMVPTNEWREVLLIRKEPEVVPHFDRPWKMDDISGDETRLSSLLADKKYVAERKYDGSHYRLILDKDRTYLISRKEMIRDGETLPFDRKPPVALCGHSGLSGIDRSFNLTHLLDTKVPAEITRSGQTSLAVEIYAKGHGGKEWETPHAYMTSVMNSHPVKAELLQRKHGRLRIKVLDVLTLSGEDISSRPYGTRRKIIKNLHERMGILRVPKSATTQAGKTLLLIKEYNRGGEGIVFKDLTGMDPKVYKYKFKRTWDLRIVSIQPVDPSSDKSKWVTNGEVTGAGVFVLENGQPVKITTDEMKRDAWLHPDKYLGRYAEISGMSMSEATGKIRAPILERVRLDK